MGWSVFAPVTAGAGEPMRWQPRRIGVDEIYTHGGVAVIPAPAVIMETLNGSAGAIP